MAIKNSEQFDARLHESITEISAADWDRLNSSGYPFFSHGFLSALETSGSVGADTGWQPLHICLYPQGGGPLMAAMPAYIKYHSYGEYVFDHSWAHAFERAGGSYYPKLLGAVPFTPVPGPRFLYDPAMPHLATALLGVCEKIVTANQLSSAHVNFINPADKAHFTMAGWMVRKGMQFHWHNRDYHSFDDFLAGLSSRKRKNIRKERQSLQDDGVTFLRLTGGQILPEHWQHFYRFYLSTIDRKWGGAYLSEAFFTEIGRTMADHILLVLALYEGQIIAGALNFIGPDSLYGRNWGCLHSLPFLHFETCYYQAIEFAIERGLKTVEAGAQGLHKVQRGYLPVYTYSAHWLADTGFSRAVSRFLDQETDAIDDERQLIMQESPYKQGREA